MNDKQFRKALEYLKDPEAKIRKKAVVALARSGRRDAIKPIRQIAMVEKDPKVRHYARRALDVLRRWFEANAEKTASQTEDTLTEKKDEGSNENLTILLESDDTAMRITAAKEMGESGSKEYLPLLSARLNKEFDPFVTATIVKSLGMVGGADSSEILIPFLKHDDDRIVANAIEGLTAAEDPQIIVHLADCLAHESNRVKANALKALKSFSGVNPLFQIQKMSESENPLTRESSVYVLNDFVMAEILELFVRALADSEPRVRNKAIDGLKQLMKQSYQALIKVQPKDTIHFEEEDEMDFVEAPEEVPVGEDGRLKILLEKRVVEDGQTSQSSEGVKKTESKYLNIGSDTVEAETETEEEDYTAVDETKKRVRFQLKSIMEAAESGDVQKIPDLAEKLPNTKNPILRSAILMALSKLGDHKLTELIASYLNDEDARVRADAIEALENINAPDLKIRLQPLLNDPAARVKANALAILGQYHDFDVNDQVRELLESRSPRIRRSGIFVVHKLGRETFIKMLDKVIDDPVEKVRKMAVNVLKNHWVNGSRTAHNLLKKAQHVDEDILEMLNKYDQVPEMTLEQISDITLNGPEYLRKHAIFHLVKHEEPEVENVLDKLEKDKNPAIVAVARTARKNRG